MFVEFTKNLHNLRKKKGLSIWRLAQEVKIQKNTLRALEYGYSEPKAYQLLALCDYFGITDMRQMLTQEIAA